MSNACSPHLIVLAGPNGAGKSTAAPTLLQGTLGVMNFVNADTIAQGLSAFDPERAALSAGRIMLTRIKELASQRADFAFETTLASRTFAPWISDLIALGYHFSLVFLWIPNADLAVKRVAKRVRAGGHSVPSEIVRRRYEAGLRNFFNLYSPMASTWRMYNNAVASGPKLVAEGSQMVVHSVFDEAAWAAIGRFKS